MGAGEAVPAVYWRRRVEISAREPILPPDFVNLFEGFER